METLKKYWWLFLLLPVVAYMVYVLMNQDKNQRPKPGSPEYARQAKAEKALLRELELNPSENGTDNRNAETNKPEN